MPKVAKALGAIQIRHIATEIGRHAVGTIPGLLLVVRQGADGPAASWVLRTTVRGRRAEIGLGGYPAKTLADATKDARDKIDDISKGIDPVAERREQRQSKAQSFEAAAQQFVADRKAGWRNDKHAKQWSSTLTTYALPIFGSKHVRDVTTDDVLRALRPIWANKTETATRVRQRIELVLNWAAAQGWRDTSTRNPAQWRGHLDQILPAARKVARVEHHAALPYGDLSAFLTALRAMPGIGPRALEFVVLTAARSGEARGATWGEIDIDGATWTVPAKRMKSGREHRVPLSPQAIELLQALPRFEPANNAPAYVFPGTKGQALSDMTLTACLRRMKVNATAHGFRSTFRDWAAETTSHPPEVAEMALAHVIGNQTEAAYRRGDLFAKRRALMDDWGRYCTAKPESKVVSITARKRADSASA